MEVDPEETEEQSSKENKTAEAMDKAEIEEILTPGVAAAVQDELEQEEAGQEIFLPTTKGMFSKGDKMQIFVQEQWRDIEIKSCYRKNKRTNPGSIYNLTFTDSDQPQKMFQYNLNEIAWRDTPVQTSKVKLTSKENKQSVLISQVPYHQHHTPEAMEAKKKELDKLRSFGAFKDVKKSDLTPEQLENQIATTLVHKPDGDTGNTFIKARFCARGDHEEGLFRTDSPTCAKSSLRLGLSIAATKKFLDPLWSRLIH